MTRCSFKRAAALLLLLPPLLANVGCARPEAPPPLKPPRFDQQKAFDRLRQLCEMGPRNHGGEGHKRAEGWIRQSLAEAGVEVGVHEFRHTPKGATEPASFRNIVGRIRPDATRRVLVGTHYDTRSWADRDARPELRDAPIVGANDGGSGVAVLLELAAAWQAEPPPVGVDIVFFDGEDFGRGQEWDDYFLGSKAWVRDFPDYRPEWGVILDMVGDASLRIRKERESLERAPSVAGRVWEAAARVRSEAFARGVSGRITDDHTAFIEKGMPVVLLIDFDYPFFHTADDTIDKCSAESLGQVGRAVMEAVEAP
ncbi:MAG TPA: M28 family peptidase [Pyrinomonadaceae bacterium]|nr:M28 family peptidase [Pyrinomonadaceae bacterium]